MDYASFRMNIKWYAYYDVIYCFNGAPDWTCTQLINNKI